MVNSALELPQRKELVGKTSMNHTFLAYGIKCTPECLVKLVELQNSSKIREVLQFILSFIGQYSLNGQESTEIWIAVHVCAALLLQCCEPTSVLTIVNSKISPLPIYLFKGAIDQFFH